MPGGWCRAGRREGGRQGRNEGGTGRREGRRKKAKEAGEAKRESEMERECVYVCA